MQFQQFFVLFGTLLWQFDASTATPLPGDSSLQFAPRTDIASVNSDLQQRDDLLDLVSDGKTNAFNDDPQCAPFRNHVHTGSEDVIHVLSSECINPKQYTAECTWIDSNSNIREQTNTFSCADGLVCQDVEVGDEDHALCVPGQFWEADVSSATGTSTDFPIMVPGGARRARVGTEAWGFTSDHPAQLSRVNVSAIMYSTQGNPAGGDTNTDFAVSNPIGLSLYNKVTVRVIAGAAVVGSFVQLSTFID